MTASKIEWTGRSDWNPIRGCTRVSEGCRHCYAEVIAARFSDPGQAFHGFAERTAKGARWTGRVELVEDRLTLPLRWKKSATIFASSTSDIFHESLSDADIDRIFAVMALAPQHTFQVLTKRAERMRAYMTRLDEESARDTARRFVASWPRVDGRLVEVSEEGLETPLPNVWLGVSVEDQAAADARIPHLLATPAAKRFLSCEPLLGPVALDPAWYHPCPNSLDGLSMDPSTGAYECCSRCDWTGVGDEIGIDWVIAGGESGRGARPMHPSWARSLRDQCAAAGVPFFFKQWGEYGPEGLGREKWIVRADGSSDAMGTPEGIGHHPPRDGSTFVFRVGKARAGRLLDGVAHSEVPA